MTRTDEVIRIFKDAECRATPSEGYWLMGVIKGADVFCPYPWTRSFEMGSRLTATEATAKPSMYSQRLQWWKVT